MNTHKYRSPFATRLALLRRPSKAAKALAMTALFAAIGLSAFAPRSGAATLYWDGGTANIAGTGDGTSQGGTGTWNTTIKNWDPGAGLAYVAWPGAGNSAVFGGTAGTVTVGTLTADAIAFNTGGYVLNIGANTLTLAGLNGTGVNSLIYAGAGTTTISTTTGTLAITGSATVANTENITAASGAILNLSGIITQGNLALPSGLNINGPGTVNFTSGTLTPGKFNVVGGATFNSAGNVTISSNGTYTGVADTALSTWNVTAGTVAASTILFVGNGTGTSGLFTISGGTASFSGLNIGNRYDGGAGDSTGTVTVSGGTFTSSGAVTLGSAFSGVGTLNLNGGTFNAGSTFALGTGASGSGGSGTINFNGSTVNLTGATSATEFASGLTLKVGTGGAIINTTNTYTAVAPLLTNAVADGGLTKGGTGTLILTGANTYNGATTIGTAGSAANGGTLTVSGAAGTINTSSGYTVNGTGSQLNFDYTLGAAVDRLNDNAAAAVTLNNGGELRFATGTAGATETFGTLTLGTGVGTTSISVTSGGAATTITSAGVARGSNFATGLVRATSLGTNGANAARFLLTSTTGLNLIGTSSTAGATNLRISPFLMGDTSSTGVGKNFVTYDTTTNGLRLLTTAEQTLVTAGATGDNVRTAAGANGVTGAKTFNSLLVGAGTATTPATTQATVTGDGNSLLLTSGALANVATTTAGAGTVTGFSSIIFGTTGANEAIITNENTSALFTIASPIDTSSTGGGLTKGGGGTVVLSAVNLYTGVTTVNQGTLQIGNGTSGNLAAGSGTITIAPSGTLGLNLAANDALANTIVDNGTISKTAGTGVSILSGNISGTGGLTVSAPTLALSGNNTYSGVSTVNGGGTLQAIANAGNTTGGVSSALSNSSALTLNGSSATTGSLQLRADSSTAFNTGTVSGNGIAGNIVLLGSTAFGTSLFNFDVNQVATGSNNTLSVGTVVFDNSGSSSGTETVNVTGGNGYTLQIGALKSSNRAGDTGLILNPTTANVIVGTITTSGSKSSSLTFNGSGNTTVLGTIAGPNGAKASFNQTGTVSLNGTDTAGNAAPAFNNGTTVLNITNALTAGGGTTSATLGTTTASANNVNLLLGGTNASATVIGSTGGVTIANVLTAQDLDTGLLTVGGQNTSGINTYSGTIKLGATTDTAKSVNLVEATGTGEMVFTGVISNNGASTGGITVNSPYQVGVAGTSNTTTVTPTGFVRLNATNTYTGSTTVNGGTLSLSKAGTITAPGVITPGTLSGATPLVVNSGGTLLLSASQTAGTGSTVTLSGGTFAVSSAANATPTNTTVLQGRGATLSGGTVATANSAAGLGMLTLTANSTLAFNGMTGTVVFGSFDPTNGGADTNGFTLNVTGTNFGTSTTSADGTTDRLIFNQDVATYLTSFTFNGVAGASEVNLGGSFFEVIPTPVPEPSTMLIGTLLCGVLVWRRFRATRRQQA